MLIQEWSDLGQNCLAGHICQNILGKIQDKKQISFACKHVHMDSLISLFVIPFLTQGLHRLEKSLKIKFALKSTGNSLKDFEKSLNSYIFCRN